VSLKVLHDACRRIETLQQSLPGSLDVPDHPVATSLP